MPDSFNARMLSAAERVLVSQGSLWFLDVMIGTQFIADSNLRTWKLGRLETLAESMQGGPKKIARSLALLRLSAAGGGYWPMRTRSAKRRRNVRPMRAEGGAAEPAAARRTRENQVFAGEFAEVVGPLRRRW